MYQIDSLKDEINHLKIIHQRELDSLFHLHKNEVETLRKQLDNTSLLNHLVSNIEITTNSLNSLSDKVSSQAAVRDREIAKQLQIREQLLREKKKVYIKKNYIYKNYMININLYKNYNKMNV